MKAPLAGLVAVCLVATSLSAPRMARAQTMGSNEKLELPPGTYIAPRDWAHLVECYERSLTIKLSLDPEQRAGLITAIKTYHPDPKVEYLKLTVPQINKRLAVRDSSALALLRTAADSAQYKKNASRQRQWFAAGNCNGKP